MLAHAPRSTLNIIGIVVSSVAAVVWWPLQHYDRASRKIRKKNFVPKRNTWDAWMTLMWRHCWEHVCETNQFVLCSITVTAKGIWINFYRNMSQKLAQLASNTNRWGNISYYVYSIDILDECCFLVDFFFLIIHFYPARPSIGSQDWQSLYHLFTIPIPPSNQLDMMQTICTNVLIIYYIIII